MYVNRNGFINTIDDTIEEIKKNLNHFKFLYPGFIVKINLIKGYFFSKLNYRSPFLTITNEQIEYCENMIKWFLRGTEKDENNKIVPFRNSSYWANISLERLCRPIELGGKLLHRLLDIFSGNKAKFLIKAMLPENKNKLCYILLSHLVDLEYKSQKENNLLHPHYRYIPKYRKTERKWEWFQQAEKIYSVIKKETTVMSQQTNINIYNLETKKIVKVRRNQSFTPVTNTIPFSKKIKPLFCGLVSNLYNFLSE